MKDNQTPILDPRDAAQVFDELLARRPAYVPELVPADGGAGRALLQIFARYMQMAIDRLNQAPDKNLLAFLDMLGISLISARPARAPVVFQPMLNAANGRIVAGTRLGAQVPGRTAPVMFETENAIATAAARLVEVVTLWPARDEYADHSTAVAGGRSFTLFEPGQPVRHELYLGHDTLFAFAGKAMVEVEFELATPGSAPLKITWEYWDGQVWRPFKDFGPDDETASQDGTGGLTRSGAVRLRAECGQSVKTTVNGIKACWVRGRLDQPLPPDPKQVLPAVDRIRLRTVIERLLQRDVSGLRCVGDVQPDRAFSDGTQLDLSTTFFPLGRSPDPDSVFYLSSEEVFSKPGAEVTLCFRRAVTPEEETDGLVTQYELDVNTARELIRDAARQAAETVRDAAASILELVQPNQAAIELTEKKEALDTAINELADLTGVNGLVKAAWDVVDAIRDVDVIVIGGIWPDPALQQSLRSAYEEAQAAASAGLATLEALSNLSPIEAAAAGGAEPPTLLPPRLVWEYWNGRRWKSLIRPVNDDPTNFLASGEISFAVPEDLEPTTVNGVTGHWLRVRLASGSFNRLRLVSWYDTLSDNINFFPIIEPRPPALEDFFLGYTYRSPWKQTAHCLTYNDFQFELHSRDVRWPGGFFPPFRPVADTTPALYLGFDRPLPNDLVSLYLDVQESEMATPPLVWETWDGTAWRELSVTDETAGLRRPGMVSFIAPDVAPRPQATLSRASGTQIIASSALEAAVFQPENQVVIRQDAAGEMAIVQQMQDALILLETPLAKTYTGGTVSLAALPRFGKPLDWVRARLKQDGAPAESRMHGIYLNAAWAVQVQTLENETLGSGTSQPNQTLFFTQIPVLPGEEIEIRELEGARADVELPILREELLRRGLAENDIRPVFDRRTGRVTEVWVRWQSRPHLFFSGPDDRHYMVERARGRLIFGDGRNGRIPPVGANNVRARRYRAGGGLAGNVPAGAITQLLGAAPFVQAVTNPRVADGGAEGETPEAVKTRGPQTLRHRGRSLSARDYEALAREASPGVAAARALPATAPNGRPAPGWVTVIIVPQSQEPQPQPSFELRHQVHDYLAARAPATVAAERIAVIGPTYLPIGVAATVAPRDAGEAGAVEGRVRAALESFLHPLTGGPEGRGWPFDRDVFLSDVAAVLESVDSVDYVEELDLLLNDTPQGERVEVPPNRIVVAGPIRIEMKTAER